MPGEQIVRSVYDYPDPDREFGASLYFALRKEADVYLARGLDDSDDWKTDYCLLRASELFQEAQRYRSAITRPI